MVHPGINEELLFLNHDFDTDVDKSYLTCRKCGIKTHVMKFDRSSIYVFLSLSGNGLSTLIPTCEEFIMGEVLE